MILFDIELPVDGSVSIDNTIQAISSKDVSKQFIADLQEYAKSMCTGIVGNSVFQFSAPADIENVNKYAHQLAYKHKHGSNKSFDEAADKDEDGYYEEDDIEQFYHDSSEDELRKMGAFDNLNDPLDEGVGAKESKKVRRK